MLTGHLEAYDLYGLIVGETRDVTRKPIGVRCSAAILPEGFKVALLWRGWTSPFADELGH